MKNQYWVAIGLFAFLMVWMFVPRQDNVVIEDRYAMPETDRTVTAVAAGTPVDAGAGGFTVLVGNVRPVPTRKPSVFVV